MLSLLLRFRRISSGSPSGCCATGSDRWPFRLFSAVEVNGTAHEPLWAIFFKTSWDAGIYEYQSLGVGLPQKLEFREAGHRDSGGAQIRGPPADTYSHGNSYTELQLMYYHIMSLPNIHGILDPNRTLHALSRYR